MAEDTSSRKLWYKLESTAQNLTKALVKLGAENKDLPFSYVEKQVIENCSSCFFRTDKSLNGNSFFSPLLSHIHLQLVLTIPGEGQIKTHYLFKNLVTELTTN